ncbi:MAG: methionyl-tRNA formyltransferase [Actinomycetota bacterium]|nr:methionyl-tRNA formyltransferase [Actinomycetota bacterium]
MSVPPLVALHEAGCDIEVVVTRADKRRGRGKITSPSPVKQAALDLGLTVTHDMGDIVQSGAELGVVVAYGRIIPADVLMAVPMLNLHFSLLPRWRGAAPVERAILAGDDVTGVCVMDVEESLDTGAVYASGEVPIGPDTTADELRRELVGVGTRLLIDQLETGLGEPEPQRGDVTYAHKVSPDERRLDWHRPALELHRVVRIGNAFTTFRGHRFKLHAADRIEAPSRAAPGELAVGTIAAGDGRALRPVQVQPAGSPRMSWEAYANGARPSDGERFGDEGGGGTVGR